MVRTKIGFMMFMREATRQDLNVAKNSRKELVYLRHVACEAFSLSFDLSSTLAFALAFPLGFFQWYFLFPYCAVTADGCPPHSVSVVCPATVLPWRSPGSTDPSFPLLLHYEEELIVPTIALKESASFWTELVSLPPSFASSATSDVISLSFN